MASEVRLVGVDGARCALRSGEEMLGVCEVG